jgi:hypothetical protein
MSDAAVIDSFRAALVARGIIPPPRVLADGRIHRCDAAGKHGKGDAAYLLHLDPLPVGGFENWRDGKGWETWRSDTGRKPSAMKVLALSEKVAASRREREARCRRLHCAPCPKRQSRLVFRREVHGRGQGAVTEEPAAEANQKRSEAEERRGVDRRRERHGQECQYPDEGTVTRHGNGSAPRVRTRDARPNPRSPPIATVAVSLVVALTVSWICPP